MEHEQEDGSGEEGLASSNGNESQMFKDLFQVTNKSKGIAGIENVNGILAEENAAWEMDPASKNGPKLVSAKKTEELQMLA